MVNKVRPGRHYRVGDEIQRELAVVLREKARDPRLSWVTVTAVEVSSDLSHAKVWFTSLQEDVLTGIPQDNVLPPTPNKKALQQSTANDELLLALQQMSGFLRSHLARILSTRTVPQLVFSRDTSLLRGMQLSQLIEQARASDLDHQNVDEKGQQ